MYKHWRAWLANHPSRTAEWLKEKIKDGFEIHHLEPGDGDEPRNVILIDGQDHKMIHGAGLHGGKGYTEPSPERLERGKRAYDLRVQGYSWRMVMAALNMPGGSAQYAAAVYAKTHSKPWPVGNP
jgi:hypothetical protein